jgi:tRNA-(ms[2]io[6]A)-hydroxylase
VRAAEHALWTELLASEARHYRTFVDLAARTAGGDRGRVESRLDAIASAEAKIVAGLPGADPAAPRTTIHG